jgi:hypothetical protein
MNEIKKTPWTAIFFAFFTALILIGVVWTGYGLSKIPQQHFDNPDVLLPVLTSVSAVGLLISLAFLAIAFSALDLSDRTQALGLPEGSIRALIALLLITLFVITSIFLYRQLRFPIKESITTQYTGISEAQLAQIPPEEVVSIRAKTEGTEKTFDVDRRIPPIEASEASQRFAEQILTAVSTLVATVAAFYFGTRSVAVARGIITTTSSPVVRSINLTEGRQGDEVKDVEILGKNFDSPKAVKLVGDSKEIPIEELSSSETRIRGKVKIPLESTVGKYKLIVTNKDGGEDSLVDAFEVKEKEPPAETPPTS